MTKTNDDTKKRNYRGKKRGMKPRSQRNRKRPRGGVGILTGPAADRVTDTDDASTSLVQIDILPLKFPGDDTETNKRIRAVKPYPFTFATFAKARWLGRSILEIYHEEFGSYPKSYYEAAIKEGRIRVNGEKVECDYKIKGNDELAHVVHRHEPVVAICSAEKGNDQKPYVRVVHEDDDVIVVDKPSTIPVHPCGGYNFQSLFHILVDQDPSLKDNLFNIHRLDRLTSGLTIVAKNTETAKALGKCIMDRENCHKVYLARVKGKFPLEAQMKDKMQLKGSMTKAPCVYGEWSYGDEEHPDLKKANGTAATGFCIQNENGEIEGDKSLQNVFEKKVDMSKLTEDGKVQESLWLNLSVPVEITDPKHGVCEAGSGKPAQTLFAAVHYDEETDSTVVLAKPVTGRTHQIRLHLQYLGHPICNDPNYGGDIHFSNKVGKKICLEAQQRMDEMDRETNSSNKPKNATSTDTPATEAEIEEAGIGKHGIQKGESLLEFIKRTCVWCGRNKGEEDRSVLEFLVRSEGIWLHALQYRMVGASGIMCFKTNVPEWAI